MAQLFTDIKLVRGQSSVIGTNDRSKIALLNNLGFQVQETDDDGVSYFEVDSEFVQIRRPRDVTGRREMTDEQKATTKARLVLARAAKDPAWTKNNIELVTKWATSHPEVMEKYFPDFEVSSNGKAKAGTKAKASASNKATARKKAPEPEPEPEPEEEEEAEAEEEENEPEPTPAPTAKKGGGLAGRLKVRR